MNGRMDILGMSGDVRGRGRAVHGLVQPCLSIDTEISQTNHEMNRDWTMDFGASGHACSSSLEVYGGRYSLGFERPACSPETSREVLGAMLIGTCS